jgi:gamma-glutamyltranspeptidase/glutathione hydrolase
MSGTRFALLARTLLFSLCILFLFGCAWQPVARSASPSLASRVAPGWPYALDARPATGNKGMVVSDAPLATDVGIEMLKNGGNAVDAAVATAFALAVVLPGAGNIGGGGFIVTHVAGSDYALDFRETAPGAATRDMFLNKKGIPDERSVSGPLSAGVPGTVAGLWAVHQKLGARPWRTLLEPAIRLAQTGFEVDADLADAVANDAKRLARFPGSAALFLPGGKPIAKGHTWKNPELAATLQRVAERGPDGFYRGETADLIVTEMRRSGGIISHQDLAQYQAKWRTPVQFTYRSHRAISMPPSSSGGLTLALIARLLESYDLGRSGWGSPEAIHLEAESMRRAFAVRNQFLGDPDFISVPQERFLSEDYVSRLRGSISTERATPSTDVSAQIGMDREGKHTTHFSVADGNGNAVAMTTTINFWFGSAVTVRGAGLLLNDEMDDFASKPGVPNALGLVQGEANAIVPGKRMLSAMAPTIVLDEAGNPLLVTGAAGGPFIITTVFQLISDCLDFHLGIATSASLPRIHHQHLPDELCLEKGGFNDDIIQWLQKAGHKIRFFSPNAYDGSLAATIERRGGQWLGQSDPRLHGLAKGY